MRHRIIEYANGRRPSECMANPPAPEHRAPIAHLDPVQKLQRQRERSLKMKAALEEQERKNRPRSFINRSQAQAGSARDVSSKKTELMDGHGVMELPPPVAKGWMMKRGEHNSSWKRRYFGECILFT